MRVGLGWRVRVRVRVELVMGERAVSAEPRTT